MDKPIETGFYDRDENPIHAGDCVIYNDNTYLVMIESPKETEWKLHPCGNNPHSEDILLKDVDYRCEVLD